MKKNIRTVKMFQKILMCLLIIIVSVISYTIGKLTNANADETQNYEYVSDNIDYNNENSNLNATNVKDAIDELYGKVGKCPTGQFCSTSNDLVDKLGGSGNFISAYTYDENSCITGNESGCVKTNCYVSGTCPIGTIIDYFVNNATVVRFHVLHDNGSTLTMQTQKNIVYNVSWHAGENDTSKGPDTIMAALKTATDGWTNVSPINITSTTKSFIGVNSIDNSCTTDSEGNVTCSGNRYDIELIAGTYRARMITTQEATDSNIGQCKAWVSESKPNRRSCRMFMNNFLYESTGSWSCKNSLCVNDNHVENGGVYNYGYWIMNTESATMVGSVYSYGAIHNSLTTSFNRGARAVVVVNK